MTDTENVPNVTTREEFRKWLCENAATRSECWVELKRGKPTENGVLSYLDAVEEALCFGWIDSTNKKVGEKRIQRFTPRKKNGSWTELNKERVRRLEKLGLMTDLGRAVLPDMDVRSFTFDPDVEATLKRQESGRNSVLFHLYTNEYAPITRLSIKNATPSNIKRRCLT